MSSVAPILYLRPQPPLNFSSIRVRNSAVPQQAEIRPVFVLVLRNGFDSIRRLVSELGLGTEKSAPEELIVISLL
jgi:hypothetical protein